MFQIHLCPKWILLRPRGFKEQLATHELPFLQVLLFFLLRGAMCIVFYIDCWLYNTRVVIAKIKINKYKYLSVTYSAILPLWFEHFSDKIIITMIYFFDMF